MYTSSDYFLINGVSSDTLDVWVDTPQIPAKSVQRYTSYENGTDEDGTVADDTFEDIVYSITFFDFFRPDYDNTAIYSFFSKPKTLEISRMEGFFFKIRQCSLEQPEVIADGAKVRYTVNFRLAPFRYKTDNPEITVSNGSVLINSGTRYCKPTFRFVVTGDAVLIVNGDYFYIYGMQGETVTIDSAKYIAYADGKIINTKTYGFFPFFNVGENIVAWTGNISECKVTLNERYY